MPERLSKRPWALGTAKFEILGHRRDTARHRVMFDEELLEKITVSWGEAAPRLNDEQAALQDCVEQLAPHARDILRLRYDEALDSNQIAGRMDSTTGAVRMALQRIREQLRRCVERKLRVEGGRA